MVFSTGTTSHVYVDQGPPSLLVRTNLRVSGQTEREQYDPHVEFDCPPARSVATALLEGCRYPLQHAAADWVVSVQRRREKPAVKKTRRWTCSCGGHFWVFVPLLHSTRHRTGPNPEINKDD